MGQGYCCEGFGNQARTCETRLLSGGKDGCEPEQHRDGCTRHDAQESRLLRDFGIQRGFRRWILIAAVQRYSHDEGPGVRGRWRSRYIVGSRWHVAVDGEHEERDYFRIHTSVGSGNRGAAEESAQRR